MKAQPDCLPCMMRQALNTARITSATPAQQEEVLKQVASRLPGADMNRSPAAISQGVYEIVASVSGNPDPYREAKHDTNQRALAMLPGLRKQVFASSDPLDAGLHAAVSGNIIDFGIGHAFNLEKDVAAIMKMDFAIHDVADFREELRPGRRCLYMGDNAGEIVFDRILVELFLNAGVEVTYSVKSGPIINDATIDDAREVGMTELTRVIETGGADIGVNWNRISPEFRQAVDAADFIVAKGHGNYETSDTRPGNFYFLLKAKCGVVAASLGVKEGQIAFLHKNNQAALQAI